MKPNYSHQHDNCKTLHSHIWLLTISTYQIWFFIFIIPFLLHFIVPNLSSTKTSPISTRRTMISTKMMPHTMPAISPPDNPAWKNYTQKALFKNYTWNTRLQKQVWTVPKSSVKSGMYVQCMYIKKYGSRVSFRNKFQVGQTHVSRNGGGVWVQFGAKIHKLL